MEKSAAQAERSPALAGLMDIGVVISASLFVALCAKISAYLPVSPIPFTLSNFAVLLVGMVLGPWRGAAALGMYLAEGVAGLPVFSAGPGGLVQLTGPTGGYLMTYPAVAWIAGAISERWKTFAGFVAAGVTAEVALFAAGISWLMLGFHQPPATAFAAGVIPFIFAEIMKITLAAGIASRSQHVRKL